MKAFLTTLKGKIIAAVATVAVVGGVTTAVVLSNSGYRTIAVKQLTGVTHVANNGSVVDAHVGQHLKSGDDVKVTEASNIVLSLDSDKFVYAEANTHFWIEATGKESDSRTKIHLDSGSVISRIDNKLKDSETFEVETPNGTMSVRGTVFKVDCYVNENGETMSELSVLDGEVYIGAVTEEGRVLTEDTTIAPGEKITIKSDPTVSEFVRVEGGTGDGLTESIDLGDFTQGEANFIGLSIDEGKEYYFTKEVLFHKAEIEEHSFDGVAREVAATCTEDGYTFEECTICGGPGEIHVTQKAFGHSYEASQDGKTLICTICGDTIENPDAPKEEAQQVPETTAPETTAAQTTTAETTTAAPTTAAPATAAPAAAAPTTVAPTTVAPTTEAPTTAAEPSGEDYVDNGSTGGGNSSGGNSSGGSSSTEAPTTTAPETTVPSTTAPETTVPSTTAPETTAPSTTAPETTVDPSGSGSSGDDPATPEETTAEQGTGSSSSSDECVDAAGHNYVLDASESEDATCVAAGINVYTCTKCQKTTSQVVPIKGHSIDTAEPLGDGSHQGYCPECNNDVVDDCSAGSVWGQSTTNHWHECTVCGGSMDYEAHAYTYESTSPGYHEARCEVCGYSYITGCTYSQDRICNECGEPENTSSSTENGSLGAL